MVSNTISFCFFPNFFFPNFFSPVFYFFFISKIILLGLQFEYVKSIVIKQIVPQMGLITGNTNIQIMGSGFINTPQLACKFGNLPSTSAIYKTSFHISCLTPSSISPMNNVQISVTLNGIEYSSTTTAASQTNEQEIYYRYVSEQTIHKVTPSKISAERHNNTMLTVSGTSFYNHSTIQCFFQNFQNFNSEQNQNVQILPGHKTKGVFINDTTIMCSKPMFTSLIRSTNSSFASSVSITNNGQEFSNQLILDVVRTPIISSFYPTGAYKGANIKINISGHHFIPSDTLSCGIPQNSDGNNQEMVLFPTTYVSNHLVLCNIKIPSESSSSSLNTLNIKMTNNNQDFSIFGPTFKIFDTPLITKVSPLLGPILGNTKLMIYGTHLPTHDVACRFGNSGNGTSIDVPATSLLTKTSTIVTCLTPVFKNPGIYTFNLIIYNKIIIENKKNVETNFDVHEEITISSISETVGLVTGGLDVLIYGTSFRNVSTLTCKFNNQLVSGHFINTNQIKCTTPSTNTIGRNKLSISFNNYNFIDTKHTFLYVKEPKVYGITPRTSPMQGGITLILTGEHFDMNRNNLMCCFNGGKKGK